MAENFRPAQLQPFTLSGSGASMGATSITLGAMLDIDGNTLTMAGTFGSIGFGTMEPGNSTLEEQICFTGLTNNANGTVTLTGISNVGFEYPYTRTSGLAKTHAGSTTFVISNTSGFYDQFVAKDDSGNISQVLTFTVPNYPQVDNAAIAPTLQAQFATKEYVDQQVIGGAPNATTSIQGLVQLPTQAEVDAGTATGGTGASLTPTPALLRSKLLSDYVVDTGAADAYVITPSPAIAAYATGQIFTFKSTHTNTTASTLNVNSKGAKAIKKLDGATALEAGDIASGQLVMVEYDGTNFQMLNVPAVVIPSRTSNANTFLTTDGSAVTWGRPFDYQSFTGSGTWTKPSNLSGNEMVLVQAWGGGGGGGAGDSSNDCGGSGGGATFKSYMFRAAALSATETVTIGAGGTGGVATAGTAGGNTTFGSKLTAYGGGAGGGGSIGTGGGGAGNAAVGSDGISGSGSVGGNGGSILGGAGGSNTGGSGAASNFGGGGGGGLGSFTGGDGGASVYGGGGGGGGAGNGSRGTGGASTYGGGGGGATGGTSEFGGAGGSNTAGVAPGGGGAGGRNASGFAGARGECRVWVFL